ncbi:MAG TPA: hypothetical protein VHM70_32200, partial [Polyangiaceae bacterium]|nr:hypothetical protein [Polyangiaceae bacterium]
SGKLRGWSSGEGAASVRIGPDGSVYLQRDQGLERYRDLAHLDAVEALPAGLIFTVPMLSNANCCGL